MRQVLEGDGEVGKQEIGIREPGSREHKGKNRK